MGNSPQKITKKIIREAIKDAIAEIRPEKVILFGSYAYGSPNRDSDVDLLFIKDSGLSGLKRYCWVSRYIKHLFPMEILVKTQAEIKNRLNMGDPFYKEIVKKGKVLYESSK